MSNTVLALVGNPNSGKTTLFNGLTGGHQYVGNWPGVTVEKKVGVIKLSRTAELLSAPFRTRARPAPGGTATMGEREIQVVDLPGIYTLTATAEDQRAARDFLMSGQAQLVVNVVDATNLERNLYLTTQLLEMRLPLLVALTMADQLDARGLDIQVEHLAIHLGHPVICVNANDHADLERVKLAIRAELDRSDRLSGPAVRVTYPNEIEEVLTLWEPRLGQAVRGLPADERWAGLRILEGDGWMIDRAKDVLHPAATQDALRRIRSVLREDVDVIVADHRYGFIHGIVQDVVARRSTRESRTDRIDRIVTHRVLGIPIFLAAMYLVFWVTIQVGGAFIDFFDILLGTIFVDGLGTVLHALHSPPWLIALLSGGLGAGIQTVATFVPIIFMMFFMLSALEDSGYMARAAFVMDRFMRLIGLPGRAFVPMLVGFGCTIPAILGTRVLETKRDRYMTIFMAPLMSCGARLPVYALISSALFPARSGLVVFSLYAVGIILSVLTGLLLKATLFHGQSSHFIMELPPYHAPRMRHIMIHATNRLMAFVKRAGLVIVGFIVILGFANTFGWDGKHWSVGHENTGSSLLAAAGKAVTPVFGPLGVQRDNWPAAVGLFAGLFAKEAVVGTLNAIYGQTAGVDAAGADGEVPQDFDLAGGAMEALRSVPRNLAEVLQGIVGLLGVSIVARDSADPARGTDREETTFALIRRRFSPPSAYAYLLFVLIYVPCAAAMATAIRELGVALGVVLAVYLTGLAWSVATLAYQIWAGHSAAWILAALGLLAALVAGLWALGVRLRRRKVLE